MHYERIIITNTKDTKDRIITPVILLITQIHLMNLTHII